MLRLYKSPPLPKATSDLLLGIYNNNFSSNFVFEIYKKGKMLFK